jgi:exopolysaccharide production protein ExoY
MTFVNRVSFRDSVATRYPARNVPLGGRLKRIFDVAGALVGVTVLFPLLVGCALALRTTSDGPVLFRHRRVGFAGKEFYCFKFATMVKDADKVLAEHLKRNPAARDEWQTSHKLKQDPRVTALGQLLRRTSLDELPQLLNVLRGDMSLVGPRPIVGGEIEKYGGRFIEYIAARPGITGLWQVKGRNNTTYNRRVACDVSYVRNWSLLTDLKIVVLTIPHMFGSDDAY